SSRRRHTRSYGDWSSDVCSSDLDTHFVKSVTQGGDTVYAERLAQSEVGLDQEQIDELDWTLQKVAASQLGNGWDVCGKTGTWQYGNSTTENSQTWMVGYTRALTAAVWLGTTDGGPLVTKDGGHDVFGANYPGAIWRQFMNQTLAALKLDPNKYRFEAPKFPNDQSTPSPTPPTSPSQTPSGQSPSPSGKPS